MTRKERRSFLDPISMWSRLAVKNGEMMLASIQVIQHRTGRMAASAGTIPNARDRREFTLMASEKIEAAAESTQAFNAQIVRVYLQVGMLAYKQWLSGASALASAAATWPFGPPAGRRIHYAKVNPVHVASHFSASLARLAHHGLEPIHSRAVGNARRLNKFR